MVRKINATIKHDPSYGSVRKINSSIQYDPAGTMRLMTAPLSGPAPQPDFLDTAAIIGWEVMPAIAGSLALSWLGPKGIALGGAMGSAAGNYMSQQYRIERGFQRDLGYGELAAATAIGAVPLSALPGKGALARTAIRGAEGSALATGELYARTYLDEGRAPTSDEISKTLLFGAAFGGVLGAAEAKWLSMKTGVDDLEGKTRPQALKLLENEINDVGGPANYEVISPTGFFTFRDPYGNFSFSRQARLGAPKTGSDVIIEIEAMPVKDYAEGVLSGLENKLLLETDDMVRGLARSDEVAPEFQGLKDAFEKEIASSNELFTGINPIVAKGNLADNKRLREIDAELEELERLGHLKGVPKLKAHNAKIAKLEKERDRLHLKHGIIQVRGGGAGLAAGAGLGLMAEDEDAQMGLLGGAGVLAAGMLLPPGAGAFVRKSVKQAKDTIAKANKRIEDHFGIGKEYTHKDSETGELITKVRDYEDSPLEELMNDGEGGDWPHSGFITKREEEFFRDIGFTNEDFYNINKAHFDRHSHIIGGSGGDQLLGLLTKEEYLRLADRHGFHAVDGMFDNILEQGRKWKKQFKQAGFSKKDIDRIDKTVEQLNYYHEGPIYEDFRRRIDEMEAATPVADKTEPEVKGEISPATQKTWDFIMGKSDEDAMPSGWTEHVDPSSGRTYYYNSSTKESTWTKPVADDTPKFGGGGYAFGNLQSPTAVGLASGGVALSQAEEEELREIGPWGIGLGMFAAATTRRKPGFIARLLGKGKKQADNEVAEAAKANKTPPPVEPSAPPPPAKTGTTQASQTRKKQTTPRDANDARSYYFDELIKFIEDGTDPLAVEQAVQELARRASRDTQTALRLQRKLDELQQSGKAPKLTKTTVSEEGAGRLAPAADPATRQAISEGIDQGTIAQPRGEGALKDMTKDELLIAIQRGDADSEVAAREALRRAASKPKTRRFFEKHAPMIFPAILASGVSIGAVADILEEEDENGQIRQAGMGGFMLLLLAAGLGRHGYRKFMKTKQGRQAKIAAQLNPNKVEPDAIKSKRVDTVTEKAQNLYVPPSELRKTMQGVMDLANHILVPLSRNLKKINPILAAEFRKHDGNIRVKTREYMDRASPFITKMTKRLKKNQLKFQEFKLHLLNGDFSKLAIMLDDLEKARVIGTKERDQLGKEMIEMRDTLDEIRTYAREEGGIDVGYFENYFPRQVNDYASFKRYLDETLDNRDLRNDIDKALDEYAKKYNIPSRDLIPADEAAEVTSRVLRGYPTQPGATLPPNFKKRSLNEVTPEMLDAYADPADALKTYIERAVDSTERRIFLGRKPATASKTVGFEGSRDQVGSDLGMRMDVDESLAATVANRLAKEQNLSQEDVTKLASIIQSRFSGKTVDPIIQGIKNASYIQVMGNFGSAITQLAEISYAAFFHGFDNTFHALFNRKDNFNFTKHFGLQDHNIDAQTSAGGLSKLLDKVFAGVGLKKLDQLSKNTIMNASWKKYRAQALREGESGKLMDELSPVFGKERARVMIRDLVSNKPNSKNLTKPVEELIWYKFLDLNPATLTEMPSGYTESGNARILYMLKTFTIKQFDVYREAAGKDVARATALYKKGNKKAAAKAAGEAVAKFAGLATLFAAANASTDVVKDTLYGRPTKPDELVSNNILRLAGVNRYLAYQAKREGFAKSLFSMALPPTAVFDRAGKDLMDVIGDGEYKGNMLQGTPFDLIYWRYLGGLDKIENAK